MSCYLRITFAPMKWQSDINGIVVLLTVLSMLSSCAKEITDCTKGRGKPSSERRVLPAFNKVEVYDKIDLILEKDSLQPEYAVLEGWKNLLPSISLQVKDGTLQIHDNNTCNFVRDLDNRTTVKLYIHNLNHIGVFDDAGITTSKKLNLDSLTIWDEAMHDISLDLNVPHGTVTTQQESAGDITLKGYCAVFVAVLRDVSGIDAKDFQGDFTYVFQDGTHDCFVHPYKVLGVQMNYAGNVYYNFEPLMSKSVTGKGNGKVIKQ